MNRHPYPPTRVSVALLGALLTCLSAVSAASSLSEKRPFDPTLDGRWIGNGISYSPYRDGESPGDGEITESEILQDLRIIAERWNLIRLYGSDEPHRKILEVIKQHRLPIRVMLGIWLDGNESEAENQAQIDLAIELANRFPEVVLAVNVGNEIFVYWSAHRIDDIDGVIRDIRHVRSRIAQPVTVSDDYNFWNKPESRQVAAELDFICLHGYAVWNQQRLADAMDWTESTYRSIQAYHPEHTIAFCETGWPTSKVSTGDSDEARLVKARVGETEQQVFFAQYDDWVRKNRVISFYFTSFDEKWKGGFDGVTPMKKMEKHWGLYFSDRTPKAVIQ
jgi:exo-beta-1,3-glucanase (GH17 family)